MGFWDSAYIGRPPWDIGAPQPEFIWLAQDGQIRSPVLDVGCGTGENALYLAGFGHEVWGIDVASKAIEIAKRKAKERNLKALFLVVDALGIDALDHDFETIIDSGFFHTLDDERSLFASNLLTALRPGGTYFMLCFSEREPTDWGGPRRVSQDEIKGVFNKGWRINYIRAARFESKIHKHGGEAWLSSITRIDW